MIQGPPPQSTATSSGITKITLRIRETIRTAANAFRLFREYQGVPDRVPDEETTIDDLAELAPDTIKLNSTGFLANASTFKLQQWFWNTGSTKSVGDRDRLVTDVLHSPDFDPKDISVANLHRLDAEMGHVHSHGSTAHFSSADGWIEDTVVISVPDGQPHHRGETDAPIFEIPHFYHRKLIEVMKAAFKSPAAENFHYMPYKQFWQPDPDNRNTVERVVDDMFTSDSFIQAHEEVECLPPEPNCHLPRAVAGLMFASDALQLTTFGNASLWPGYLYFANQSKRERTKSYARAAHHIAYFPKVWGLHLCTVSCSYVVMHLATR